MCSVFIKKLTDTADKRRLLENFFSLSVLQAANYIFPLITLPYLVRILGPEKFGLVAFAQVFIQYFNILADYGFNLSATREISIHRENNRKLSEIFSSVMFIKLCLLIFSSLVMTAIVFCFDRFEKNWLVYYLTFGTVIGQSLFPIWFFQGIEDMKYITYLTIISKLIFTICVFVFIRKVSDYIYVPLIRSLGSISAGIVALYIAFRNFKIKIVIPMFEEVKHQLREGWYIFLSKIAISLYTTSNTFILGLFAGDAAVGYYSSAERIVRAIQGLFVPVSQTIYPHISKLVLESKERSIKFIQKIAIWVSVLAFLVSIVIFLNSSLVVKVVLGNKYLESIPILRILSFLPFIISLSNVFGIQTMLPFNYKKAFTNILVIAGFINIFLSIVLVPLFKHIGASISVLITESLVTISMFVYLQNKGIKVFGGKID